jgi:hypothetical protein
MGQMQQAISTGGKQYIRTVVTYDDVETKTLKVGGIDNESGLIEVYDENSNKVVTIDKTGILVDSGNYRIIEDYIECTILNLDNLVNDHSFELLVASGATFTSVLNLYLWDKNAGNAKLYTNISTDLPSPTKFGNQCVSVNSANNVKQAIIVVPGTTYNFSGYILREAPNYLGEPILQITYYKDNGMGGYTQIAGIGETVTLGTSTSNDDWQRVNWEIVVPSNNDIVYMLIVLNSINTDYVKWDAIQLVEGNYPCIYNPESQLWKYIRGIIF